MDFCRVIYVLNGEPRKGGAILRTGFGYGTLPGHAVRGEEIFSIECYCAGLVANPLRFARVHRGRIVNISRIVAAHAMINEIYELELNTGGRLSTGRHLDTVQRLIRR